MPKWNPLARLAFAEIFADLAPRAGSAAAVLSAGLEDGASSLAARAVRVCGRRGSSVIELQPRRTMTA